jgi:ABC-2 type transport system permease protein
MRNPLHTSFVVVFQNEVLLNAKRVAPYVLMVLFTAHSVLWWGWSAAAHYGWASNSDYNIVRNLQGFSFLLGLPIFNAIIMGDPVIRDFREGVDPLIFSSPVSRGAYLFGKFCGSFFVLVCCQSTFVVTMLLLQWFPSSRTNFILPAKIFPYFKHFLFFVVVSHLFIGAIYFTAGALSRNARLVYVLAGCFYPLYIGCQFFFLRTVSPRWRIYLDPMLLSDSGEKPWGQSAERINQIVVNYTQEMVTNRVLVLLAVAACMTVLYFRFAAVERSSVGPVSLLQLSTATERIAYDPGTVALITDGKYQRPISKEPVILPSVKIASLRFPANFRKLVAALEIELRLLRSERSLIVILPLAVFLSTLEIVFWTVPPDPSHSAAYAGNTARSLLLFMVGVSVVYIAEAMHRDRDLRIQPLLWSKPAPNYVLLLSKFIATLLLTLALILLVGLTAIAVQVLKHDGPVEVLAYLRIFLLVLLPNAIFLAASMIVLNVVLRDRYVSYAAVIGICGGLFYLYTQGHNHWLYNPLLFQLWNYRDLAEGSGYSTILLSRTYVLAFAVVFLVLAHLLYPRRSNRKTGIAPITGVD